MVKVNLDKLAQDKARKMLDTDDKETLERLVTKTLGVLQSQGVYAMMLFLFSRTSKEKEVASFIRKPLYEALHQLPEFKDNKELKELISNDRDHRKVLSWFSENISEDLNKLLLVRELYEQMLIYARFHAKAAKELS